MEYLLADRGYDANRVLAAAREDGMMRVIPPKRSRKLPQFYDAALYQARHLVDNGFCKRRIGVAPRPAMPGRMRVWEFARYASFLAM